MNNSSVKCLGNNDSAELDQGDTTVRGDGSNEMGYNLTIVDFRRNLTLFA